MRATPQKSIVFITGAFISNNCWDEWRIYFENNGYNCIAPPWPNKYASAEALRNKQPDPAIASNRLVDLVDYFSAIVTIMPQQPIMIGHSLGGLVVQLLANRGLGSAGVALHSFPPHGVCSYRYSFIKAMWDSLAFFTSTKKSYMISFAKWKYIFANGMDYETQKELYYAYAIPESKLLVRDALKCKTGIDFEKPHAPLLFISGSNDQVISPALNYSNFKKYRAGNSIAGYKVFEGRNHLVFGHPAWKEQAGYILNWLQHLQ